MDDVRFDSFRLEAWSQARDAPRGAETGSSELRALREALTGVAARPPLEQEDSVPLTTVSGEELGVVRFRFTCDYAHRSLVREFFEHHFVNPRGGVGHPGHRAQRRAALRERAQPERRRVRGGARDDARPPTRACGCSCDYRDRSIEQEVQRLAVTKTALIGFIDLMLLAGLGLVWANVRRELQALPAQERLRGERQPRAEDAARPHPPLRGDAGARPRADRGQDAAVPPDHQQGEPAAHPAHQQHPRLLAHRGGAQGVPVRAHRRGARSCATWWTPTASRSSSRASRSGRTSPRTCPSCRARPGGAVAGPHQPGEQRDQVQPGREVDRGAARGATGTGWRCRWPTAASASRRRSRSGSSRSSTARRAASSTRRRAAGWGSPSCSTSWRPTGATSR